LRAQSIAGMRNQPSKSGSGRVVLLPLKICGRHVTHGPGGRRTGRAAFFQGTWMSLGKIATTLVWRVSFDRESALSFGYFSLGATKEK
jgi:hypothetical protein